MVIKKEQWLHHCSGIPYGLNQSDMVILHYADRVANDPVRVSAVVWQTTDAIGYEVVTQAEPFLPAISESPRLYTVPEGYVFHSPYGTYDAHRMMGWTDDQLKVNDMLKPVKQSPAAILQPAPMYQVPIGYIWAGEVMGITSTYAQAKYSGKTDEDLIKRGYLVPVVAPSAVPAKNPNIVLDSKESLVPDIEKACKELDQSAAPLRDDLDPASRYYDAGGIETIDVIKAKLTPEQLRGYLLGNLIKYSCRMNFKGSAVRDAEKCKYYSQWLAELEQENV